MGERILAQTLDPDGIPLRLTRAEGDGRVGDAIRQPPTALAVFVDEKGRGFGIARSFPLVGERVCAGIRAPASDGPDGARHAPSALFVAAGTHGWDVEDVAPLGVVLASPGISDAVVHLFAFRGRPLSSFRGTDARTLCTDALTRLALRRAGVRAPLPDTHLPRPDFPDVEDHGRIGVVRDAHGAVLGARTRDVAHVLAIAADGTIRTVRQVRYPHAGIVREIPAGGIDAGETPAAAAARELEEEVQAAGTLTALCVVPSAPWAMSERAHLFLARDIAPVADPRPPDAGEVIEAAWESPEGFTPTRSTPVDAKSALACEEARLRTRRAHDTT